MSLHRRKAAFTGAAAATALIYLGAGPASAQRLGPDLLQTLGVGSRSVAMGNAYSAIADDASATFWNPARLSRILQRSVMIQYRSVVLSRATVNNGVTNQGVSAGDPQLGFASFVYPLTRPGKDGGEPRKLGTVGFSYTLGGYFNYDRMLDNTAVVGGNTVRTQDEFRQTVRNQFFTLAYGNDVRTRGGNIGYGLGAFYLNNGQSRLNQTTVTINGTPTVTSTPTSDVGDALGYLLGLTYEPTGSLYRFAVTHRSGAKIGGLSPLGSAFADEIPSRTTFGVAYEQAGARSRHLTLAAEAQMFSGANSVTQTDHREAVTNFHLGAEYGWVNNQVSPKGAEKASGVYLRTGYHTNANAAKAYTYYDDVFSFGVAYRRAGRRDPIVLSIEPSVEVFRKSGTVQYSFTGSARF